MSETATSSSVSEQPSSVGTISAVRAALELTRSELGPRSQEAARERTNDFAVAMRLAGEALATATRAAETDLRKTRELLEQAEGRARRAEERASIAEQQVAEWEKTFCKIRDDIDGRLPRKQLAA
jgi:hypothetical protein